MGRFSVVCGVVLRGDRLMTTFEAYRNGRYCGQVNVPIADCAAILAVHYMVQHGYADAISDLVFVRV